MSDLLVRGGTIVDGTGAVPHTADLRIRQGRIAEIGPQLRPDGEAQLDASGAFVSPGFIDVHTHFDPTLFWDAGCDPMPQHGVTSVLIGNCSLSLAPVRPGDEPLLQELFSYVEDIPAQVLETSLPWGWESFQDYLSATEARGGFGVNVATLVGHTMLRQYVMRNEAWDRTATPAERRAIAALLAESLRAGAFGMSSSLGFDEDRSKRPVPSRLADDAEFEVLLDVLADLDRCLTFIPNQNPRRMRKDVQRMADLCGPRGIMHSWIGVLHLDEDPPWARSMLDFAGDLRADGIRSYPQVSPRTLDIHVNWNGGMSWFTLERSWHRMVQAPSEEKETLLRSAEWRALARDDWDRVPRTMIPHKHLDRIRLVSVSRPDNAVWVGATLADLVAARGGHPSDVLADWLLENDLDAGIVGIGAFHADPDGVAETLTHPAAVIANSDAGAHVAMMCAAGDTTLTLTRNVRDRGDLMLEQAVHRMTKQLADLFGFSGRGVLETGAFGDLAVFALDELEWKTDVFVEDLPTGAARLRRPPGGFRYTVIEGSTVQVDGELTGQLPGRLLRRTGS